MTEQMPGELIYEYTIRPTGATSYGVPALDTLLSVRMLSSGIARPPLALATAPRLLDCKRPSGSSNLLAELVATPG